MNVNRQLTNKAGFTLRYNQIFRVWQKAVLFFIGESLAPPVALLILIKSAEYLFSPASSIQHPASSILVDYWWSGVVQII